MTASSLRTNITSAMKRLGYNQNSLAEKAGLKPDAVRDIMRGKSSSPRGETLQKLAQALHTDVGELLTPNPPESFGDFVHPEFPAAGRAGGAETLVIQEYDVTARRLDDETLAGQDRPQRHPVLGQWTLPADLLNAHLTPRMTPAVIRMVGNSMEPELASGDRVMVDTAARVPTPPGIYVLWDGLGLVIKQCELVMGSDPRRVRITSLNPSYAAYEMALNDISIQGRVMGKWMWK